MIIADGLVLPFDELINWHRISVRIPEVRANETRRILESIPRSEACAMRDRAQEVYASYLSSPERQLDSLLKVLHHRGMGN